MIVILLTQVRFPHVTCWAHKDYIIEISSSPVVDRPYSLNILRFTLATILKMRESTWGFSLGSATLKKIIYLKVLLLNVLISIEIWCLILLVKRNINVLLLLIFFVCIFYNASCRLGKSWTNHKASATTQCHLDARPTLQGWLGISREVISVTLWGMRWRWIEMEVEPLKVNSKWSERCAMKSWEGPRVSKYVE